MMSGSRSLVCFLVITVAAFGPGCKKRQQPKLLQIAPPKPITITPPKPLPQPDIQFSRMPPPQTIEVLEAELPPPPAPKRETKRVRRTAPQVSGVKSEEEDAAEGPAELPQLGEILTEQQQRDYTQALEASLEQAKRIALTVQRRPLDPRQADVLGQVLGFIRQAEAAQKKDISLARNLAHRAEVLAKDLLYSLK